MIPVLRIWILLVLGMVGPLAATADTPQNVILLTLDGVRYQEFFGNPDPDLSGGDRAPIFSYFWTELAKQGRVYGTPGSGSSMVVANSTSVSLPAYFSILTGKYPSCFHNLCGQVEEETLQERLIRDLQLPREKVATIASWRKLSFAAEQVPGTGFVNAGINDLQPVHEAEGHDFLRSWLNFLQDSDRPPWADARFDRYTFAHAMRYLKIHQPRFMFISLNDSDEWAHRGKYRDYLTTLRQYDRWIRELVETLHGMGEYGENTTILISTDHGRGEGRGWEHHGPLVPESKFVWLFGVTPKTKTPDSVIGRIRDPSYSHLDIRPTIETIFGLKPMPCDPSTPCGKIMEELI